jgi:hypothetical protein
MLCPMNNAWLKEPDVKISVHVVGGTNTDVIGPRLNDAIEIEFVNVDVKIEVDDDMVIEGHQHALEVRFV